MGDDVRATLAEIKSNMTEIKRNLKESMRLLEQLPTKDDLWSFGFTRFVERLRKWKGR